MSEKKRLHRRKTEAKTSDVVEVAIIVHVERLRAHGDDYRDRSSCGI